MKLSEAQIRQVIREELKVVLNENDENKPEQDLSAMDYVKYPSMGAGVAAIALGINKVLIDIQTNGIGHEIAVKLQHLSDMVQHALKE